MNKRRILFLKLACINRIGYTIAPPLGILYVASYVKNKGEDFYEMKLIDMQIEYMTIEDIRGLIGEYKPDVVGISACSQENILLHKCASMIKRLNKNIFVVIGGPHPTQYYNDVMQDKNIDVAVLGEGEITFYELIRSLDYKKDYSDIPGMAYNKNGKIVLTSSRKFIENLDDLPFPAWELIDIDKYSKYGVLPQTMVLSGKKYMTLLTSRGCPFKCIYCVNIVGDKFRPRSPENIYREIEQLYQRYGVDEFHIVDDTFNLDNNRVKKICNIIINSGLKIKLAIPIGLRGDLINKELLLKLKKAGTYLVSLPLESATKRIQQLIKKNLNIEEVVENIKFADKIGMLVKSSIMLGFPTETIDEIKATISLACKVPLSFLSVLIVSPQKGTELFTLVKKYYPKFKIDLNANYNFYDGIGNYIEVTKKPLKKLQIYAHRRFYLNPVRMLKILSRANKKIFVLSNLRRYLAFFLLD